MDSLMPAAGHEEQAQNEQEQQQQEEEKMKTSDVYSSAGDTLKAADLQGKSARATISGFEIREYDETSREGQPYKSKKIVLSFEGKDKKLVVNKTNALTISSNFHTDELENWVGKQIVMYSTQVSFGDQMVDAIRVRAEIPEEDLNDPVPF